MKSSITLCVIAPTKKEAEPFISRYREFFDDVVVVEAPDCKDFAAARTKAQKQVKTPFWMWADVGDTILNPEKIRELVALMEQEEVDAVYLQYEYGWNEERELIALHWRERIIRTSHPFEWKGAVHETLISSGTPKLMKHDSVVIRHEYKDEAGMMKSALRNHKIMEDLVKGGDEDPRTLYYLGRSYFMMKKYREAAQTLMIYIEQSGWDEQKYDAWMKISDALVMMDEFDKAINATMEAIKLNPRWPDAYLRLGDLYLHLEQPSRALEWLKVGIAKPQPQTLEIIDPTLYTYRPLISMALANFGMAKVVEAKKEIDAAAKFNPKTSVFKSAYDAITKAYIEDQTIKSAVWLGKFVEEKGDVKKYVDGLPGFMRNDLRMRPLRMKAHPPIKWPKKSIAIYCGESWDDWGADTLDKGMGGSEEAVVYLSRELAKQGWAVTIYNQRVEDYKDGDVVYKPWETFSPDDEFDVFVSWRNPWLIEKLKIKARLACIDFHDFHENLSEKSMKNVDLCFFKSEFQAKGSGVPKEKWVISPNGIDPSHFEEKVERNPKKVMFISSADRGLDLLVRAVWPEVKKAVPDAELSWAYGWESYDYINKGNAKKGQWKWQLKRDMFNEGVKELGRLSHKELAKELQSSGVWAYPTSFPEIFCMSATKAQAAGTQPITSGYAALQEVLISPEIEIKDIHSKPEEIKKFTQRLIDAIKNPLPEKQREEMSKKILDKYAWQKIAQQWLEKLDENRTTDK